MEEKYRISDVNVTQGTKVVVGGVVKDQVDFDSDPQTQINNINAKVSAVYIPQGSIPALVLLDEIPSEDNLGYVWNVTGEFITNDKFIEGAGKKYPDGTNVTVIKHTTDKYYFDILGTNIDLSQYSTTEEINTMLATRVEHITHQVTNNIQQSDATAILNNYSQFNGKFIEFLTNTNKSIGWGFVSTDSDNKQYLIVINNDGTITQWNKTTFEKHNFETKSLIGETIDIDNLTIDVAGEAPFLVSVRNAVNKPEKTGTDGYVIVVAVTVNQQIQYYTDIATNKQYYRLVSGVANSHSFTIWVEMGAGQATADTLGLVKAVEATEDMTQDVGITAEGKLVTKAGGGGLPPEFDDTSYIQVKMVGGDQVAFTAITSTEYPQTEFDWGDGTSTTQADGAVTHTYVEAGTYVIKIKGVFDFSWQPNWKLNLIKFDWKNAKKIERNFYGCNNLTTVVNADFSGVKIIEYIFNTAKSLEKINSLNTKNVNVVTGLFSGCESLKSVPFFDTSEVLDATSLYEGCKNLVDIPKLDFSKCSSFSGLFNGCSKLVEIPALDLGTKANNKANLNRMFSQCSSLLTIPLLNTKTAYSTLNMFQKCINLRIVPALDMKNVTDAKDMFRECPSLTNIHMINIGANLDISASTLFTREALNEVISNLVNKGEARTLTMGAINKAKLTEADIQVATDKGWTIA